MTAQEWLDELERLRKAATPGPWDVSQKNSTVYDNYGDSVCDTQQTHNSQRLIEMVQDMSCTMAGMPGMESTPDEILQDFFEAMEPEE